MKWGNKKRALVEPKQWNQTLYSILNLNRGTRLIYETSLFHCWFCFGNLSFLIHLLDMFAMKNVTTKSKPPDSEKSSMHIGCHIFGERWSKSAFQNRWRNHLKFKFWGLFPFQRGCYATISIKQTTQFASSNYSFFRFMSIHFFCKKYDKSEKITVRSISINKSIISVIHVFHF